MQTADGGGRLADRVPGHAGAFAATGHGMPGVTLGPVTGHRLAEYVRTGRRREVF